MSDPEPVDLDGEVVAYRCADCGTRRFTESKAIGCCADSGAEGEDSPEEDDSRGENPGCEAGESGRRSGVIGAVDVDDVPAIASGVYPTDRLECEEWHAWKPEADGRKVPRAPWLTGGDAFVSAQDPDAWVGYSTAREWIDRLPGYGPALNIRDRDEYPSEDLVLFDYDDARDPETGRIHPTVREHIERAGSYADVSTSGTGVHILARGALPDGVKAIDAALPVREGFPDAEIEVYDSGRFIAMTGRHIEGTPTETRDAQAFVDDLADEFATVAEGTPDEMMSEPEKSRDELADVETTDDKQDVFDAIRHTGPRDVRLRSTVTHERGDGSKSMDPSWSDSDSGTRLAQVGDGWVYRKGMHGLDALQVVALEERLITDESEYPTGETFWRAVDTLRERGAHIPEYEGPTGESEPVSALPLAQLDALDPNERRQFARRRGLSWPTTDELRERIRDRLVEAVNDENDVVLDVPTAAGKSYTTATTRWSDLDDVTDGAPVVQLSETREAREQAARYTREDGGDAAKLLGRRDACSVARGDHDPLTDEEREQGEEPPDQVITIEGRPASAWLDEQCDDKGVAFSAAHQHLDEHNDQRAPLPCCPPADDNGARYECRAIRQWNGVPRDDEGEPCADVVHATHQFAHVPGLTRGSVVVFDEQPDFTVGLAQDRIRRMIAALLDELGAPVTTFEAFVSLARMGYGGGRSDAGRERDALVSALFDREPGREWYLTHPDAHTLAPAVARALWKALGDDGPDANGRRRGRVPHEPPRLDAHAHEDEGWNREWVTVVVDEQNTVRRVRAAPDLSGAKCVIGLDAHPTPSLWELNTKPGIEVDALLEADERRLWRRFERGLCVVQVGGADRPAGKDGRYFDERGTEVFLKHLREHYGDAFATAITAKATESEVIRLMRDAGIDVDLESTMHFGEEKSRNDFGGESVGAVLGCIDAGDDYVLDTLAEIGLDAGPETATDDEGEEFRAFGRGFVGPDAATASALVASVRENHVAQGAGRYARDADDPADTAVVFCRTAALPTGYADYEVPGVERVAGEKQRLVTEVAREHPGATARELKAHVDDRLPEGESVSKRHVAGTLVDLLNRGVVRRRGDGAHGADTWDADGVGAADATGEVDLVPEEIAKSHSWGLKEYEFVIHNLHAPDAREQPLNEWGSLSPELADGGDRPPDGPG